MLSGTVNVFSDLAVFHNKHNESLRLCRSSSLTRDNLGYLTLNYLNGSLDFEKIFQNWQIEWIDIYIQNYSIVTCKCVPSTNKRDHMIRMKYLLFYWFVFSFIVLLNMLAYMLKIYVRRRLFMLKGTIASLTCIDDKFSHKPCSICMHAIHFGYHLHRNIFAQKLV